MSSIGDLLTWLFRQEGEQSPVPPVDPFALPSVEGSAGVSPPLPQPTTNKSSILERILNLAPGKIEIGMTAPPQETQQFQFQEGRLHPVEVAPPEHIPPVKQRPLETSLPPPPGPVDLATTTQGLLPPPGSEKEKIQRLLQEAESPVQLEPNKHPSLHIPGRGRIPLKAPRRVKG